MPNLLTWIFHGIQWIVLKLNNIKFNELTNNLVNLGQNPQMMIINIIYIVFLIFIIFNLYWIGIQLLNYLNHY
jgi:hypothetical protein